MTDKPVCGIAEEFYLTEVPDKGRPPFKSRIDPLSPDYEAKAKIKGGDI